MKNKIPKEWIEELTGSTWTANPDLSSFQNKTPRWCWIVIFLGLFILGCLGYVRLVEGKLEGFKSYEHPVKPKTEATATAGEIVGMIAQKSYEAGIDPIVSLRIARCESSYNEKAKSKTSSGKGLYQFLDRTFLNYCQGDPLNAEDSINCFLKLYKSHPNYWVCKG